MRKISEFQEEIKIKREYLQGMLSRQTKCDNVCRPGIVDVHVLMDPLVQLNQNLLTCSVARKYSSFVNQRAYNLFYKTRGYDNHAAMSETGQNFVLYYFYGCMTRNFDILSTTRMRFPSPIEQQLPGPQEAVINNLINLSNACHVVPSFSKSLGRVEPYLPFRS